MGMDLLMSVVVSFFDDYCPKPILVSQSAKSKPNLKGKKVKQTPKIETWPITRSVPSIPLF